MIEATYNPRTIAPEDVRDLSLRIQSLRILLTRLHHVKHVIRVNFGWVVYPRDSYTTIGFLRLAADV